MSTLKTNNIEHLDASSPSIQLGIGGGINVSGIVTATRFDGNITGNVTGDVTGNVTGNINSSGISTLSNVVVGGATTELVVTGDARITGILTVGTASVTLNGTDGTITGINTINGLTYPSAGPLSNRNLIINGAMQVAQRGTEYTGATNGSTSYRVCDRWRFGEHGSPTAVFTLSQSTTAPDDFKNSYKYDVTTAQSSLADGDVVYFETKVEGQNVDQLAYGTSSAKSFTLSFYVKSSIAGTFVVWFYNPNGNLACTHTYTVNATDTWERKSITVAGDTSNSLNNGTNVGLQFRFILGAGTNFTSGTASTTWGTSSMTNANRYVGQTVNIANSLSDEWLITGVQLEVGTRATPFEHRSYGDELARCQRYYYKLIADTGDTFANGYNQNTTSTRNILHFPVTMRVAPTSLEQTGTAANYRVLHGTTVRTCSAAPTLNASTVNTGEVQATTADGLTAGQGNALESNSNGTYLAFTAEL